MRILNVAGIVLIPYVLVKTLESCNSNGFYMFKVTDKVPHAGNQDLSFMDVKLSNRPKQLYKTDKEPHYVFAVQSTGWKLSRVTIFYPN